MERDPVPDPADQQIVLPAEPASAARAREFVRARLRGSEHEELEDAAVLCVTELVANVALHTNSSQCVVTLVEQPDDVIIEVADEAQKPPVLETDRAHSEHGRGLRIVEALAGEWGVSHNAGDGKSVWLRLGARGGR